MIKNYKYIVLGAGPSGLSFANRLLQKGETSFLVLEKEAVAGGLCRSTEVYGSPLDFGGGHFLDVKRKNVLDFLFSFMSEDEWNKYDRISKINMDDYEIDYPFESHIWQMPLENQVEYLLSISKTGSNVNEPMPEKFIDWIYWKLGDKIAENYMIPYNKKIFSSNLDELGTYWLYKLPNVSFKDTLTSCLYKKQCGILPAHGQFLYPKQYGYGEVWKRMGERLKDNIVLNTEVKSVDFDTLIVNEIYKADKIINTIPWVKLTNSNGLPENIKDEIGRLKYSSINVSYFSENVNTDSHWTYFPDEALDYHRILYRHNFCNNSKGYWTEANSLRSVNQGEWSYKNEYAYPLNTIRKPEAINKILEWSKGKSVYGLGRWGEWEHMNSDVAVEKGIELANAFLV